MRFFNALVVLALAAPLATANEEFEGRMLGGKKKGSGSGSNSDSGSKKAKNAGGSGSGSGSDSNSGSKKAKNAGGSGSGSGSDSNSGSKKAKNAGGSGSDSDSGSKKARKAGGSGSDSDSGSKKARKAGGSGSDSESRSGKNRHGGKDRRKRRAGGGRGEGNGGACNVCASGTGDPHMTTFDGLKYDCQGEGDFVLSKSLDSDFEFQGRFEKVPGKSVTTTQGVVLNTGFEGEPKVEVSYTKTCDLTYFINGAEVVLEDDPATGHDKLEFYASGNERDFIFASGVTLKVTLRSYVGDCLLNSYICLPCDLADENIVGILGSPDDNSGNDYMNRDASIFTPKPTTRQAKNEYCTNTWCVARKSDNLFIDPVPTCADAFDEELDKAIEEAPKEIKDACGDNEACLVDAVAADDVTEGLRTLEDEEAPAEPPTEDEREEFPAPPKEDPKDIPGGEPALRTASPPEKQKGSGSGDPHFKTWTGAKYDYHGECDLVLLDNPSFNDGMGLRVHIRTTRVKYFSFIEKVAVQIGDEVLEFDNDVENFYINGEHVGENQIHHKTRLGGFVVRRDKKALSIRLQDDGTKEARQAGHVAKIDLHTRKNGFPAVIIDAGRTDLFKGSLGMLGEFGTGRTLARDGVTEIEVDPVNGEEFALEWQVRDTDPSLFIESRFPQFPQTCIPPKQMVKSRLGLANAMEEAKEACSHWKEDIDDCIFDVVATRDATVAEEGHIVHVE